MALCLRIIIEYPIIGNFFKENKYKSLKKKAKNVSATLPKSSTVLDDKIKWTQNPVINKKKSFSQRLRAAFPFSHTGPVLVISQDNTFHKAVLLPFSKITPPCKPVSASTKPGLYFLLICSSFIALLN